MKSSHSRNAKAILATVLLLGFLAWFGVDAGRVLVVNAPERSDAILVLAGETDYRPKLALNLLAGGYARRVVIDVPADAKIYEFSQVQLAENYIRGLPQSASIEICPIEGLSTRDETRDSEKCLGNSANRILIVTSDYHTRRALSIYRHEIPGKSFSVAGARDETQFGTSWWKHRQWAKTCVDEWLRLLWWTLVDHWR